VLLDGAFNAPSTMTTRGTTVPSDIMEEVGAIDCDGKLLGMWVGKVLPDGASEATTTIATGDTTVPSDESSEPIIIADIATMTKIKQRRNLILGCFHQRGGGSGGSIGVASKI